MATGTASGVSVVDIDVKHPEAADWYNTQWPVLLPTRVHRTRSGGWHLLYRHHAAVKNSASKICRGVDVRGEGGYVIFWPAAGYPVSDAALAPWPEFLIPKPEPVPASSINPVKSIQAMRPGLLKAKAVGLVGFVLGGVPDQDRNHRLFWAANRVREMDAAGAFGQGLSRDDLLDALFRAARHVGLPEREVRGTLRSGMRRAAP